MAKNHKIKHGFRTYITNEANPNETHSNHFYYPLRCNSNDEALRQEKFIMVDIEDLSYFLTGEIQDNIENSKYLTWSLHSERKQYVKVSSLPGQTYRCFAHNFLLGITQPPSKEYDVHHMNADTLDNCFNNLLLTPNTKNSGEYVTKIAKIKEKSQEIILKIACEEIEVVYDNIIRDDKDSFEDKIFTPKPLDFDLFVNDFAAHLIDWNIKKEIWQQPCTSSNSFYDVNREKLRNDEDLRFKFYEKLDSLYNKGLDVLVVELSNLDSYTGEMLRLDIEKALHRYYVKNLMTEEYNN